MPLVKCPRCELNYMDSTEKLCKVCARESSHRALMEEPELCTICNEVPALPGKDVCIFCLKELNEHAKEAAQAEITDVENDAAEPEDEELSPDMDQEPRDGEYGQIVKELSLEEMEEQEAEDDTDEDDDA